MSLRDYIATPRRISAHELLNLIVNLPPGCALDRATRGEAAEWTTTDYLLARLTNITQQAHSNKRVPDSQLITPPDGRAASGTTPTRPRRPEPKTEAGGKKAGGWDELNALYGG